jgi:hypothetical protein
VDDDGRRRDGTDAGRAGHRHGRRRSGSRGRRRRQEEVRREENSGERAARRDERAAARERECRHMSRVPTIASRVCDEIAT